MTTAVMDRPRTRTPRPPKIPNVDPTSALAVFAGLASQYGDTEYEEHMDALLAQAKDSRERTETLGAGWLPLDVAPKPRQRITASR